MENQNKFKEATEEIINRKKRDDNTFYLSS